MNRNVRKFLLALHLLFAVGWFGAAVAYLVLAVKGINSNDPSLIKAIYLSLKVIGWFAILPLCLATVLTGLVQSLGTSWGLFRHYWIVTKFILTMIATIILMKHLPAVSRMAELAAQTNLTSSDSGQLKLQLIVHAAGGIVVLIANTVISVYKPWGLTPYGKRRQN